MTVAHRNTGAALVTTPPLAVVLAVNVAHDREARGWTQEQLAVYAGLTRNTVNTIEKARDASGSSRTRTVEAIAAALDTTWVDLLAVRGELTERYAGATRVYAQRRSTALSVIAGAGHRSGQGQVPLVARVRH